MPRNAIDQHAVPNPSSFSSADRSGIDDLRPRIEVALEEASRFGPGCPERLGAAIRYSLLAPGKRLRPALTLMAAEACGGTFDQAMPAAVAVEMVHAYSLIHDDLPAMDDDDLRRGRPTVHIQYDEATAILAGDALQAQAFAHLATRVTDPARATEAMAILAQAASCTHLVGGQADDLAAEKRDRPSPPSELSPDRNRTLLDDSLARLESIHRRKTGALIAASLDLGAVLVGADDWARKSLAGYADGLGLAFQVVDDILDHTSDARAMGKRTGKDAQRGKLTYPGIVGIEGARQRARQLVESAKRHASVFGDSAWRLTWLADYVLERSH